MDRSGQVTSGRSRISGHFGQVDQVNTGEVSSG